MLNPKTKTGWIPKILRERPKTVVGDGDVPDSWYINSLRPCKGDFFNGESDMLLNYSFKIKAKMTSLHKKLPNFGLKCGF